MTTEEQPEEGEEEVVQEIVQEQQVEEERVGETSEEKAMKLKQYADVVSLVSVELWFHGEFLEGVAYT